MSRSKGPVVVIAVGAVLVLVAVGVFVWSQFKSPEVGPLAQPSGTSLTPVPTSTAAPSTSAEAAEPESPPPAEPGRPLHEMPEFMPESFSVVTPRGPLNPERVPFAKDTIAPRGGSNLSATPAMVVGSLTALPGSGEHAAYAQCHSQINPPMACNFLSEMTQADQQAGSQVLLYGQGIEATYQVGILDTDIRKGQLGRKYIDGPAGTLVILTCNLDLVAGSDTFYYRILVAHLVSWRLV